MSVPVIWTDACEDAAQNAVYGLFAPGMDRDDMLQEARIGVCHAMRAWQPAAGMQFSTFAQMCARRRALSAVSAATRMKHAQLNRARSFEHPVGMRHGDHVPLCDLLRSERPDPLDAVLAREAAAAIGEAWDHLTDIEREAIARCAIGGEPYENVGPTKSIDNALQRGRRKLATA